MFVCSRMKPTPASARVRSSSCLVWSGSTVGASPAPSTTESDRPALPSSSCRFFVSCLSFFYETGGTPAHYVLTEARPAGVSPAFQGEKRFLEGPQVINGLKYKSFVLICLQVSIKQVVRKINMSQKIEFFCS